MAKYLTYLKSQLSLITLYRFDLFTRWIMNLFNAFAYYYLWLLTSPSPQEAAKLLGYFVLYWGIVNNLTSGKVANFMGKDIHSGEVNSYLIKPVSYPILVVIRTFVPILTRVITPILLIIVASFFYPKTFLPISFINFVFFIIFLFLGFLIWNLFISLIGFIAFFGTEVNQLTTVTDLVINLLRGAYIPAFFFPISLTKALSFTFIPLLASFPIKLYQETIDLNQIFFEFGVALVWIFIFYFLSKRLYASGLKAFEAQGG